MLGTKKQRNEQLAMLGAYDCVETLPDATMIVGRSGQIVMAKPMAERFFGYGREEMHGQPFVYFELKGRASRTLVQSSDLENEVQSDC